jgi:osmotically-inducible protein OsmY
MKSDSELQRDVLDEFETDASIDASQIGVTAKDGVITLTGSVTRYVDRMTAEDVAKSIAGVRAVANDIEVRISGAGERNDSEIASAALSALSWNTVIPEERIQLTVRDGWVTLEGDVDWPFQRDAARRAVSYLNGVKGVFNRIALKQKAGPEEIRVRIADAFRRHADVDAQHVRVEVQDGSVMLKGMVPTWFERTEAERIALASPGVTEVENHLTIGT